MARQVFDGWVERLECDHEMWGLRLFDCGDGMIWRNAAAREHQARHGFFGAPTMLWSIAKSYQSPDDLRALEIVYEAAFASHHPVKHVVTARAGLDYPTCCTEITFYAVYGDTFHGVCLTKMKPLVALDAAVS